MHLTIPARTALQRLTLLRSLDVPDRVTLSAMLLAVIDVANTHPDELTTALAARMRESDQDVAPPVEPIEGETPS